MMKLLHERNFPPKDLATSWIQESLWNPRQIYIIQMMTFAQVYTKSERVALTKTVEVALTALAEGQG